MNHESDPKINIQTLPTVTLRLNIDPLVLSIESQVCEHITTVEPTIYHDYTRRLLFVIYRFCRQRKPNRFSDTVVHHTLHRPPSSLDVSPSHCFDNLTHLQSRISIYTYLDGHDSDYPSGPL